MANLVISENGGKKRFPSIFSFATLVGESSAFCLYGFSSKANFSSSALVLTSPSNFALCNSWRIFPSSGPAGIPSLFSLSPVREVFIYLNLVKNSSRLERAVEDSEATTLAWIANGP